MAQTLGECLVHLFQNALDHGVEAAERLRRQACSWQAEPGAARSARGTRLHLRDDGRGLDLHAIRAKLGIREEADARTAQRIFDAGVSTAPRVTSISGRGVGLDAVRAMLVGLGGQVSVNLTGPAEHGSWPFEVAIELPPHATLDDMLPASRPPQQGPSAEG